MGWGGIGPTVYGADFIGQNQSRHPPVVIPQGYFAQTFMVPFLKTPLTYIFSNDYPASGPVGIGALWASPHMPLTAFAADIRPDLFTLWLL